MYNYIVLTYNFWAEKSGKIYTNNYRIFFFSSRDFKHYQKQNMKDVTLSATQYTHLIFLITNEHKSILDLLDFQNKQLLTSLFRPMQL